MKSCLQLKSLILEKFAGETLIESLVRRFTYHDRDFWLSKIASGEVLIDGKTGEPDQILVVGEELLFAVPDFEEEDLDTSYHKIWENENLILVSKPADLPVHSTRRIFFQTMTALLRREENLPEINPIHRLDRETSGLMLYLKQPFKEKRLFRNPNLVITGKFYLAVVSGCVTQDYFAVEVPLKEAGCAPVFYKMLVADDGKPSKTEFYNLGTANGFSLLLARLGSGRKHQIRAHLLHTGFPVVGDKLYSHGGFYFLKRCNEDLQADDLNILGASHHLLHAYSLKLDLPTEGKQQFCSEFFSAEFARYLIPFGDWQSRANSIITEYEELECSHP